MMVLQYNNLQIYVFFLICGTICAAIGRKVPGAYIHKKARVALLSLPGGGERLQRVKYLRHDVGYQSAHTRRLF